MVRYLISWALNSPLIVLLLGVALGVGGAYAFLNVNVEAYPDPAPAIIEVIAQYPGASAEEVERQVTIPLEVALAGMPHLQITRTHSLAGLCHMRNQFDYNIDYFAARQEVLNRFQSVQGLPPGVQPQISPFTPTGELIRYTVDSPRRGGRDVYSLTDQKSLEDWTMEKAFKLIPGIVDVDSFGGETKQYLVTPDPYKLQQYGITLSQFENAIANSNANAGAGYINQGKTVQNVRVIGAIGGGRDPVQDVLGMTDPTEAAQTLRTEEQKRVHETRRGRRRRRQQRPGARQGPGAVAAWRPCPNGRGPKRHLRRLSAALRQGQRHAARDRRPGPADHARRQEDKVQGTVLMRKAESTLPSLTKVKAKIDELNNTPGQLLPGVKIKTTFDLTGLINHTTETVRENLAVGMVLVTLVLLMFLSNVRSALIVAVNIPLALLVAFSILFLRGQSANLLSIGAVDFGIIVDSSVIMVENIYRHFSAGEYVNLSLKERILRACHEVEKPLFFSTPHHGLRLHPAVHHDGAGRADLRADGADLRLRAGRRPAAGPDPVAGPVPDLLPQPQPAPDNFVVRWLKSSYLRQVELLPRWRWATLGFSPSSPS